MDQVPRAPAPAAEFLAMLFGPFPHFGSFEFQIFVMLAPYPACALLAGLLAGRRGGNWSGSALLGLLLSWSSLPLVLWLTREPRPEASSGTGLLSSEAEGSNHDWDEWRGYYLNLRQDLTVGGMLILLCLVALVGLGLVWLEVSPGSTATGAFRFLGLVWPSLAGMLLQLSYAIPWLGPVWRKADEIWLNSGLELPLEVRLRTRGRVRGDRPEACSTAEMLEAARNSGGVYLAALICWLTLIASIALSFAVTVYRIRHNS